MHGRACEGREKRLHMWTVPSRVTASVSADVSTSSFLSSPNSFVKDGRKISVGECALFKPPQDCPPFIGIIRWVTTGKDNKLKLGVNWLYRPAEVKLVKSILLEAAPNEVFYSFHKDEIPAASLLHPCKVAFLPKGVELPSGICSFICRRVYDITNKCFWWLTDQDYIDERQEEVDKLLYKTRLEMHATVQPGGRSPKPLNGPTSSSQLKPGSDNMQNSGSFSSQGKGKKRERTDQGSDPVKRERTTRMDDGDSVHGRLEGNLESEISKLTEKGGLVDSEGTEKLVQLLTDRSGKKIDLFSRTMLAGVVAETDKFDCLHRFVQLRGLPVFDEWLQEVHKGKIGDGSSPDVEGFLLILLQALDKLPVNLQALQMCNIGKSVNHLRSHKNLNIQKKARSLVDTWKKRVEAEMDAKSGHNQGVSWPARPRISESPHSGNRHPGGSSDIAVKNLVTQSSASKSAPVKLVQGENNTKSASPSPGSMKSTSSPASGSVGVKDVQPRSAVGGVSDVPLAAVRDEKSSSSSQSHNNSQTYSGEHTKTGGFSVKEDARSSTAGSTTVNKNSGGPSRHRKSINGFQGPAVSLAQREVGTGRHSSLQRNTSSEKISLSTLTCEKAAGDVPAVEANSHKLIVKIPNRGRSPAQSASGGSFEEPVMNSRVSSPVISEKQDQSDRNLREKSDARQANVGSDENNESWQTNEYKEVLNGCDGQGRLPATGTEKERYGTGVDTGKIAEVPKTTSLSSGNENKSGKVHEPSFSSINALIDSCQKYSEADAPNAVCDDVGMNLLASVAAGEISKVDMASPNVSPSINTPLIEPPCTGNDQRMKSSAGEVLPHEQCQSITNVGDQLNTVHVIGVNSQSKDVDDNADSKSVRGSVNCFNKEQLANQFPETSGKTEAIVAPAAVPDGSNAEKGTDGGGSKEERNAIVQDANHFSDAKQKVACLLVAEDKVFGPGLEAKTETVERSSPHSYPEIDGGCKKENQLPTVKVNSEFVRGAGETGLNPAAANKDMVSRKVDELKEAKTDEKGLKNFNQSEKLKTDQCNGSIASESPMMAGLDRSVIKAEPAEKLKSNENEKGSVGAAPSKVLSSFSLQETEQRGKSRGLKLSRAEANETEERTSVAGDACSVSVSGGSDMDAKVGFDLNEGFNADDGRNGDGHDFAGPGFSAPVQSVSRFPFPVSSISSGLPGSVTVAAAAKGAFVPPEDLLRNKGTLGWKGSAATSAFRPAEPRKILQGTFGLNNTSPPSKQSRPPLDIDLNVADERVLEDFSSQASVSEPTNNHNSARDVMMGAAPVRFFGGFDFDLNRMDEPTDVGINHSSSNSFRLDSSFHQARSPAIARNNNEATVRRDFDLNNGPTIDEMNTEPSSMFNQHARASIPSQPTVSGMRMSGTDMGNFSPWFPVGNSYSAVTIPSILPERGDQPFPIVASSVPQRILGPTSGTSSFSPDIYRGAVLSSSPAVPYQSSPFQYPVYPFGTTFPIPSASFNGGTTTFVDPSGGRLCFPAVNSQLAVTVPSNYQRPYVVSLSDCSNNGGSVNMNDSNRKWFRQGLDLNAGPGGPDAEVREDMSSVASRQLSASSSQSLAEDQARIYQMSGGVLKRKEPEGGWDGYRQSSWQ